MQINILNFAQQHSLNYCSIEYQKPYIPKAGWKEADMIIDSKKYFDSTKQGLIINLLGLYKKFVVLDTDDVKAYNFVMNLIKQNNLIEVKTKSYSQVKNPSLYYKNHFYFSLPKGVKISRKLYKDHSIFGNLDVITDVVEYITNSINNDNISEISEELLNNFEAIKEEEIEKKEDVEIYSKTNNELINDELLCKILDNIDIKRFNDYESWFILACIFVNENLNFSIFHKYASLSPKYNRKENDKKLNELKGSKNGYKLSTLWYWLKEDNIEKFKELQKERKDFFYLMNNFNATDIAIFYYNIKPSNLAYQNKVWYLLDNNNIYREVSDNKEKLLADIVNVISQYIEEQSVLLKLDDPDYKTKSKLNHKNYNLIRGGKLKNDVLDYLCSLYFVEKLQEKLDDNNNLLPFDNLVFDFNKGASIKECLRPINKDDYVSITTGYEMTSEIIPTIRNEIINFIKSTFGDENIYNFTLESIALSIFTNRYENFYIHTGSGRNGKSLFFDFIESSLGTPFFMMAEHHLLTGMKAGATNSTLAKANKARILVVSEPDETESYKLKTAEVKRLTGRDTITTRDLFKSTISYKPKFNLFMLCNSMPTLDKVDIALSERLKVVNYPFTFVDNPTKPNEKLRDNLIKEKLKNDIRYKQQFILLLLETALKNKHKTQLTIPKEIIENNNKYINDNDILADFINQCLDITNNDSDMVQASELFSAFRNSDYGCEISPFKFSKITESKGFKKKKTMTGAYYCGLKLKAIETESSLEI
jgi:P4 family phage/plasmid primase-like protien